MKRLVLSLLFCSLFLAVQAQEYVSQTFKDTRVINTHSVETLPKRKMDIRIGHRFGDFAGDRGGFQTLFGLENASDVMIGLEYGLTNNINIGLFRTKGVGSLPSGAPGLRQLLNGILKVRLLRQQEEGAPFTITAVGVGTISTAEKIEDNPDIIASFPQFSHRIASNFQLLVARKFSDGFSLQVIPAYTYRNLVAFDDENGIFSLGFATRVQINKVFGIIADVTLPFSDIRTTDNGFYPAMGIGLEIETGGHVFQVNFTNATAIMETDYIPYTTSNWGDGQYRLGFTISRVFNL